MRIRIKRRKKKNINIKKKIKAGIKVVTIRREIKKKLTILDLEEERKVPQAVQVTAVIEISIKGIPLEEKS